MRGHLVTAHGVSSDPDRRSVLDAIASTQPFWLDLSTVDREVLDLLGGDFAFHPLAVEDVEHFAQRPKLDRYDDFALLVAYGIVAGKPPVEVHCLISERFLVTVHRQHLAALDTAVQRIERRSQQRDEPLAPPVMLLHGVLDALVDGYFPVLATFDESIDALQDDILRRPTDAQLGELFGLKRRLAVIRRLASDQRDMLASALAGSDQLPDLPAEAERYFRDLYDHLVRISQTADGYRDLLSSAMDTHLSTTSNRLNVVMKQLAIIATVFLPMSFLTGFFGQNFGWMAGHISGSAVFWIAGVGAQVVIAAGLLMMFRRMGWLGDRSG